MLNKDDEMTVLSTKIPFALKNRISKFADAINVSQSRIFVEALTRYLDGDAQSLSTVENLIGRINLLEKQSEATLSRLAALEVAFETETATIQKQPSENARQSVPARSVVRSIVQGDKARCPMCSSKLVRREGYGKPCRTGENIGRKRQRWTCTNPKCDRCGKSFLGNWAD